VADGRLFYFPPLFHKLSALAAFLSHNTRWWGGGGEKEQTTVVLGAIERFPRVNHWSFRASFNPLRSGLQIDPPSEIEIEKVYLTTQQ
jgi:hypothetical protein